MIAKKLVIRAVNFFSLDFLKTLVANVGILVVNLVTGITIARFLQPEGRGIQAAIILWPQFFAYTLTFGLGTALVYKINISPTRVKQLITSGMVLSVIYGSLACIIGVFAMPFLLRKYAVPIIQTAQLLMAFAPIIFIGTTMVDIMRATKFFSMFNIIRSVAPGVSLIALLFFKFTHLLNPYSAALAMLSPSIIVVIIGVFWISRVFGNLRFKDLSEAPGLFKYGLRAYGSDIISTIADQIDKVIIIGVLTAVDLGFYGIALSFSRLLNAIQTAMTLSLLPSIVGKPVTIIKQVLKKSVKTSFIFSTLLGICMFLLARPAIQLVYGESYIEAVSPFRVLIFEAVILGCNNILAQAFIATNRPGLNGTIMIVALSIGVPCVYLLSPIYGLLGVSFGILIITCVRFFITTILFLKFTE